MRIVLLTTNEIYMDKTSTQEDTYLNKIENKSEIEMEPSKQVIENILAFSKALSVRNSNVIDKLEFILN